jgi:hypothetical protein
MLGGRAAKFGSSEGYETNGDGKTSSAEFSSSSSLRVRKGRKCLRRQQRQQLRLGVRGQQGGVHPQQQGGAEAAVTEGAEAAATKDQEPGEGAESAAEGVGVEDVDVAAGDVAKAAAKDAKAAAEDAKAAAEDAEATGENTEATAENGEKLTS